MLIQNSPGRWRLKQNRTSNITVRAGGFKNKGFKVKKGSVIVTVLEVY